MPDSQVENAHPYLVDHASALKHKNTMLKAKLLQSF
jgi:hypothetical protein